MGEWDDYGDDEEELQVPSNSGDNRRNGELIMHNFNPNSEQLLV